LEEIMKQCDEQNGGFRFQLPVDEQGNTLGFGFGYFELEESARTCQKLMHNLKLGKYEIKVFSYSALDTYLNMPDELPAQEKPQYKEGVDSDSWLYDGREQFVVRQSLETLIYWCDSLAMGGEPELAYGGEREKAGGKVWCRGPVMWSPRGRYLTTFHPKGLVIWGGPEFQRVGNFAHANVTHAEFSPCERFLLTFSEDSGDEADREALMVWNVRTQTKVKAFADPRFEQQSRQTEWPFLKWSFDGSYFARTIENGISVFATSTMKLVDGKPVPVRGIASFEWSPTDSVVAYWCPEEDDVPAKVVIFDPINKKELRSKNLFNVTSVKLFWHPQGDFVCAQVTRHTKTKKTTFTNFELFRIRDSGCPNETLSMTETVSHLAFEPNGVRFAIVHSEIPDGGVKAKMNVSIYSLGTVKNGAKVEVVQVLEGRGCQEVIWSPSGNILVLASLDRTAMASQLPPGAPQPFAGNGGFEFYDLEMKQSLARFEHYMCNEAKWDPSGRFFATLASQPMFGEVPVRYTLENGYRLYNFLGQKLHEEGFQEFYQVSYLFILFAAHCGSSKRGRELSLGFSRPSQGRISLELGPRANGRGYLVRPLYPIEACVSLTSTIPNSSSGAPGPSRSSRTRRRRRSARSSRRR
jgi:translation initiation factor 3 subunit B